MKKLTVLIAMLLSLFLIVGCSTTIEDEPMTTEEPMESEETMVTEEPMETEEEMVEEEPEIMEDAVYMDISAMDAKELIESMPEIIIIDVSPLYADGHLPGAINYPVGDGSLDEAIPMLDQNMTYLIYCHGDGPSIAGAQKLIDAGFMNVYRLEGNYSGWVDAGYSVEK
jgi:rhodanese-related sulfurtransferase